MATPSDKITIAVTFSKCEHVNQMKKIVSYPSNVTIKNIFESFHPPIGDSFISSAKGTTEIGSSENTKCDSFDIDLNLQLSDVHSLGVKSITFFCKVDDISYNERPRPELKNAFQMMMGQQKERSLPKKKTSR